MPLVGEYLSISACQRNTISGRWTCIWHLVNETGSCITRAGKMGHQEEIAAFQGQGTVESESTNITGEIQRSSLGWGSTDWGPLTLWRTMPFFQLHQCHRHCQCIGSYQSGEGNFNFISNNSCRSPLILSWDNFHKLFYWVHTELSGIKLWMGNTCPLLISSKLFDTTDILQMT